MSVDQYQQELLECQRNGDRHLSICAEEANTLTNMMKQGDISREEYISLLNDIGRKANIDSAMSDFETKQRLNVALHGLISVASAL